MAQIKLAQFRPIHAPTKEKIASFDRARYKGGAPKGAWKSNFPLDE